MTNILELLKNEKVEWKKLGEVIDYEQPTKYIVTNTNYNDDYDIPVLTAGQTFILGYTNEKEGIYKATINEPVIIFDDFTTSNHWVNFSFKIKSSAMKILKPKQGIITFRYCYHYMKTINIDVTEHKRMWISKFSNIEIPIPSLETQEKIVDILDKFTNYVTELQSELQSRTKQYTYYRDKLLSEEYLNNVTKEMEEDRRLNIFKLDEIFDFKNGLNKGKEYFGKGVPFVSYVNVYKLDRLQEEDIIEKVDLTEDEIERFSVIKGDVLFTRTSEVKEEVGYSSVVIEDLKNTVFNGFTIRARLKNKDLLLPEYSAHLFRCHEIRKEIIKRSSFTTRASLSGQELGKVKVVIPPLSLQNKIVKVLDKFQVLLSDTKGLIPEEIEQRQKQYEYYREKLLTFDVISDRFDSIRFDSIHN